MPDLSAKDQLRLELKTARAKITNRDEHARALNERAIDWLQQLNFSSVFSYLSTKEEAPTYVLLNHLLKNTDSRLSCPKVLDKTTMIAVELSSLEELETGVLGIPTAAGNSPLAYPIDVAIVPGLGFTHTGARLGYGAGYYDRWFEAHPDTIKVAFCFEQQVLPFVPTEAHDVSMDFVLTNESIYDCRE